MLRHGAVDVGGLNHGLCASSQKDLKLIFILKLMSSFGRILSRGALVPERSFGYSMTIACMCLRIGKELGGGEGEGR